MYQKIIIVGNLGRAPDMRYLPDGTAVTNMSVATNKKWTSRDGNPVEETAWFRVSVFGKQAESCNQYLDSGSKVLVEGSLQPDAHGGPKTFTRRDGTVGASYEVRADTVRFLSGRDDGVSHQSPDNDYTPSGTPVEEDDIPF